MERRGFLARLLMGVAALVVSPVKALVAQTQGTRQTAIRCSDASCVNCKAGKLSCFQRVPADARMTSMHGEEAGWPWPGFNVLRIIRVNSTKLQMAFAAHPEMGSDVVERLSIENAIDSCEEQWGAGVLTHTGGIDYRWQLADGTAPAWSPKARRGSTSPRKDDYVPV